MVLNKDYNLLFREVIAPHLHKLVEIIKNNNIQKKYIGNGRTEFDSLLGAEYSWSIFFDFSKSDSDYVARLSFWIGGLRDKFNSDLTKKQCIKLLNDVFDASILAYFEFNVPNEIYREIKNFCNRIDVIFGENILLKRFEEFTLLGKPIIIITDTLSNLRSEYKNLKIDIPLKKNLRTQTQIKNEIKVISRQIITDCLNYEKTDIHLHPIMAKKIELFISQIQQEGYDDLINAELKTKLAQNDKLYLGEMEKIRIEKELDEFKKNEEKRILLEREEKLIEEEKQKLQNRSIWSKLRCFFDFHDYKKIKKYWDYTEYKCTRCHKIIKQ